MERSTQLNKVAYLMAVRKWGAVEKKRQETQYLFKGMSPS
jgi:hypothetical protein